MTLSFESPRFAGDAVLEEILNDPDTGTKKLQAGSPPDSVMRLQQALVDLRWTLRVEPPILDEASFVIGIYGPKTTSTVLAYKQHYDIHFPPHAPTGFIDGLAGPRTFRRLDPQCVLLDEADAAINEKATELNDAGLRVELTSIRFPIDDTSGVMRLATISGESGALYYKRGVGAFEVHGPIFDAHTHEGGVGGPFGYPVADEQADGTGFRRSQFEHGVMRLRLATGEVDLDGPNPSTPEEGIF